jgi:hypothetical protein
MNEERTNKEEEESRVRRMKPKKKRKGGDQKTVGRIGVCYFQEDGSGVDLTGLVRGKGMNKLSRGGGMGVFGTAEGGRLSSATKLDSVAAGRAAVGEAAVVFRGGLEPCTVRLPRRGGTDGFEPS